MLHPRGRVSEVQRRQMTTVLAPNVHNIAVAGHVRRLPGPRQGLLQRSRLPRPPCADGGELDQLRPRDGADRLLLLGGAEARRAGARRSPSPCRPATSATSMPATPPSRWACRSSHFVVATNTNDILARFFETGAMTTSEVVPTYSPSMDIQISSNFERLLFDLYGRDGKALADAMTAFRSTGTLKVGANALGGVRELFDAGRLDDEGTLAAIADCRKRYGETLDPHTAVGYAVAQQHRRDPKVPMVVLATAHPAKFPDAVQKATGERPALPPRLADLFQRTERVDGLPNDVEALKELIDDRMAARSEQRPRVRDMSEVKVTTLANGLRVAVDEMPEVESASLGIWVACGTRHEIGRAQRHGAHAGAHGVQGHPDPLGARHRRGDRECRRQPQRLYRPRDHRLSRLGPEGGRGARRRDGGRHPAQLGVRSRRAAARARRHPAGDRPGARHARRPDLRPVPGDRAARPAARPAGAGHRRFGRGDRPRRPVRLPGAPLHGLEHGAVGGGPRRARPDRRAGREAFRLGAAHAGQRRDAGAAAPMSAATAARRARSSRRIWCWAARASAIAIPTITRTAIYSTLFGGGMSSRLFQRIREERGPGLRHPLLQRRLCRRRPVRHLCRHRRGRSRRAGARRCARSSPASPIRSTSRS